MTSGALSGKLHYFRWAFIVTLLGLILGAVVGWSMTGTVSGTLSIFTVCAILAVLEISLSFDNAVINANKLKSMTPLWQRRFLTWGILIAVFGMRVIFPLAVIMVAAKIGPIEAIRLAAVEPQEYSRIMHEAHLGIAAFGGTFLMMVALAYFFDPAKEIHWVGFIERRLRGAADVRGVEIAFVLVLVLLVSSLLDADKATSFQRAAIWGLVTFLVVDVTRHLLDHANRALPVGASGGLGAFLYLEVLDASFSFDGVIGAFALTQNLFVIAIGLGIGAMYVRSMTIMLVEKGTLTHYRYLEHGAFYAIFILAIVMYCQALIDVPELVTGLGGAFLIALALFSSIRYNRQHQSR